MSVCMRVRHVLPLLYHEDGTPYVIGAYWGPGPGWEVEKAVLT